MLVQTLTLTGVELRAAVAEQVVDSASKRQRHALEGIASRLGSRLACRRQSARRERASAHMRASPLSRLRRDLGAYALRYKP